MNSKTQLLISPSLLSCDFSRVAEEIRDVEAGGCDMLHVDVMDGHFVPNLTIGPPVIRSIRHVTKLPLDVHLMIEEPIRYVEDFKKAGSDWITFHVEATHEVKETIQKIRSLGAKVGISLRPKTELSVIEPYLGEVDLVLVMTVEPGFGGQAFIPEMVEKVKKLKPKFSGHISVDGGINEETAPLCVRAGADILVAGTHIFARKNRKQVIQELRSSR